jgi:hypothetical protein
MARARFEAQFRDFVRDFGGQVVPEDGDRSADYFFPQHNVVAELKCLVEDPTADFLRKRDEIVLSRRTAPQAEFSEPNAPFLEVPTLSGERVGIRFDERIQRELRRVLLTPIENIVRDANRQIRATKARLATPSAMGIILIFNEGNRLHAASPQHFGQLAGEVIQKPLIGERRFPHIQGMVYFSFRRIETFDEQTQRFMSIWFPAQVRGDSVNETKQFQDDLKRGFYEYVERTTGSPVVAHHRETGWPAQT